MVDSCRPPFRCGCHFTGSRPSGASRRFRDFPVRYLRNERTHSWRMSGPSGHLPSWRRTHHLRASADAWPPEPDLSRPVTSLSPYSEPFYGGPISLFRLRRSSACTPGQAGMDRRRSGYGNRGSLEAGLGSAVSPGIGEHSLRAAINREFSRSQRISTHAIRSVSPFARASAARVGPE